MVSNASEDLPEPDRPVMTVSESRGITTSTFFRLCSRAPRTWILPDLEWAMESCCPFRCSAVVPGLPETGTGWKRFNPCGLHSGRRLGGGIGPFVAKDAGQLLRRDDL